MITEYDGQVEGEDIHQIPNYEHEFMNAKTFLQTASQNTGENLYDHLTDVLNKILAERPENVIDFFEDYSRKIKERRFKSMTDHLEDCYVSPGRLDLAKKILPMLKPLPQGEPSTVDPEDLEIADLSKNDMLQLLYYFEHCGIGLPRSEMFFIMLSIRKLIHSEPIANIRRQIASNNRASRDCTNPFSISDLKFRKIYHMPKILVLEVLMPLIEPHIVQHGRRATFIPLHLEVCDSKMKLLAVNARYPGSVHDAAIWNTSNINAYLRRCFEQGDQESWLLGDSGYPLSPWLITPIPDAAENTPEWRYTKKHCSARIVIERCFGFLKQKFRSLLRHRVLHYGHRMSGLIIYSAAVLHNICVDHNYIEEFKNYDLDEYNDRNMEMNVGNFGK